MADDDVDDILGELEFEKNLEEHMQEALKAQLEQVEALHKCQEQRMRLLKQEINFFQKKISDAFSNQQKHTHSQRIERAREMKQMLRQKQKNLQEMQKKQKTIETKVTKQIEAFGKLIVNSAQLPHKKK